MRWIYISPHLDDAALSAGGWIYDQTQAGNSVEIWTIMCGVPPTTELSPFAQVLHYQWGMETAEQVVRGRRQEDLHAAAILGAQTQYFDFLDCIYRQGKKGSGCITIFLWIRSPTKRIYPPVSRKPSPPASNLTISCSANLALDDTWTISSPAARRNCSAAPLHYADIPYLFNTPEQLLPHTAGMKETVERVSEAGLAVWQEAIGAYASQISSLFESPEAMREKSVNIGLKKRELRIWKYD
jgi:hypothetical protein